MRKRWWVPISMLLVAAIVVIFLFARPAGVTWFGYVRVRLGMTADEVESVVGVSPGNYSSRKDIEIVDFWASDEHAGQPGDGKIETWYSDDGRLLVGFDREGRVVYKRWNGMVEHGPSFLDRMKTWVGL